VQFLKDVCQIVPIEMNWNFPIRDAYDTAILRTAFAGEADYICTLDKDFYTPEVEAFCGSVGIIVLDDLAMLRRLTF
jgi:predicted nucleic acid-binding protein